MKKQMFLISVIFSVVILMFAQTTLAGSALGDLSLSDTNIEVEQGQSISINANDFVSGDPDMSTLHSIQDPAHGTLDMNIVTGEITYTAAPDYEGPDSYQYALTEVEWPDSLANKIELPMTINDAPDFDPNAGYDRSYSDDTVIKFGLDGSNLPFQRSECTVYWLTVAFKTQVRGNDVDGNYQTVDLSVNIDGEPGPESTITLLATRNPLEYTVKTELTFDELSSLSLDSMELVLDNFIGEFGKPVVQMVAEELDAQSITDASFVVRVRPVTTASSAECLDSATATVDVAVTAPEVVVDDGGGDGTDGDGQVLGDTDDKSSTDGDADKKVAGDTDGQVLADGDVLANTGEKALLSLVAGVSIVVGASIVLSKKGRIYRIYG